MKIYISSKSKIIDCLLFILLIITSFPSISSAQSEHGVLPVRVFSVKEYGALPQNWGITQDHRGMIYVANEEAILEYDGENWRKILINYGQNRSRSVDFGFNKKVYIGARDEFGYLSAGEKGLMKYVSLMPLLDTSLHESVGNIWNVVATERGVYFRSSQHVFFYDGKEISVISSPNTIHRIFRSGESIIASVRGAGVCIPKEDKLIPLINGDFFLRDSVADAYGIIPLDDKYLAVCRSKGPVLFSIKNNEEVIIERAFSNFPAHITADFSSVFNVVNIDNRFISIGTWGKGIWVFTTEGKLVRTVSMQSGLAADIITAQFADRNGYLWLAHVNGISRVTAQSPVDLYTTNTAGIEGMVESIARFNNRIYVATHSGLYMLRPDCSLEGTSTFETASFQKIEGQGINSECFHLTTFTFENDSFLLICANDGVYTLDSENKVNLLTKCLPWASHQMRQNPDRILIALENGIRIYRFKNNEWVDNGRIDRIEAECKNIDEDSKGNIWIGTTTTGIFSVTNPLFNDSGLISAEIFHYDTSASLTFGKPSFVSVLGNNVYAGTGKGIYRLNRKTDKFEYDSIVNKRVDTEMFIHRLSSEKTGNLWAVIMHDEGRLSEVRYFNLSSLKDVSPWADDQREIINAAYHDNNGITWLGGTTGLSRYDENNHIIRDVDFNSYIRLVLSGRDTLFAGAWLSNEGEILHHQPASAKPVLKYRQNSLVFHFAAISPYSDGELKYSYYLEGSDEKGWSEWILRTDKEYTFLHEGTYRFHIRALDVFGNYSQSDVYEFTIMPPWYRTIWAFIGYILFFILFVWFAIHISTRSLQKIIKERTAEIVKQKDVIEQKNKDIMDSISYAKRIQETILPSKALVDKLLPNSFILYMPRDLVSGDFYWLAHRAGKTLVAAADCTGHGVPGAFMSILGVTFLNEITAKREVQYANQVLDVLRDSVIQSLTQEGEEEGSKDGMDIAFLVLDKENKTCEFAGAYNPLLLIRENEIIEYKADRMPIGAHARQNQAFTNNQVDVQNGDLLYIFSDGYIDQFGGKDGKKFMSKRFKELLLNIKDMPLDKQKERLLQVYAEWRGEHEQIDDVIVLCIKIDW